MASKVTVTPRQTITAHGLVRYIERALGFDMDALRAEIQPSVSDAALLHHLKTRYSDAVDRAYQDLGQSIVQEFIQGTRNGELKLGKVGLVISNHRVVTVVDWKGATNPGYKQVYRLNHHGRAAIKSTKAKEDRRFEDEESEYDYRIK